MEKPLVSLAAMVGRLGRRCQGRRRRSSSPGENTVSGRSSTGTGRPSRNPATSASFRKEFRRRQGDRHGEACPGPTGPHGAAGADHSAAATPAGARSAASAGATAPNQGAGPTSRRSSAKPLNAAGFGTSAAENTADAQFSRAMPKYSARTNPSRRLRHAMPKLATSAYTGSKRP